MKNHKGVMSIQSLLQALFFTFIFLSSIQAKAQLEYLGDAVQGANVPFAAQTQGLCSDANNYFIVQRYNLWKIPKSINLAKVKATTKGVRIVGIPGHLKKLGGNHLGDCDLANGRLYVPLEGLKPFKVLIFDADSLELLATPSFPTKLKHAAWVSIDASDGTLITTNFDMTSADPVMKFRFSTDLKSLILIEENFLKDENGIGISLPRVQAGEIVRSKNILWLLSDTPQTGLYGFDLTTSRLVYHHVIAYNPSAVEQQEIEGLDSVETFEAAWPIYEGNLFVSMVAQNIFGSRFFLKNFSY